MRAPSRTMPPAPRQPLTWSAGLLLALLAAMFSGLCWFQPLWMLAPASLLSMILLFIVIDHRRLRRLAAERPGESICTFARSFDYRRVDTWIIRAVFEELQPYGMTCRTVFPLRRSDDLETVLAIDAEEVGELIQIMAFRVGRSVEDISTNPFLGKVQTVTDLVEFLMHQPRISQQMA